MYETYSDENFSETENRKVTYTCEPHKEGGETVYWNVRRRCTHGYKYVGMTEAAAKQAADEISKALTRRYARWTAKIVNGELQIYQDYVLEQTSYAQAVHVGGSMWEVGVTIDDSDEIVSDHDLVSAQEIEQYFALAESRDTFGQKISVTSAKWVSSSGKIYVEFEQNISNYDSTQLTAYFVSSSGVETLAQVTNAGPRSVQIVASENKEFYLKYLASPNDVLSNHFKTNDIKQPAVTVLSTRQYMRYEALSKYAKRVLYAAPAVEIEILVDQPIDESFVYVNVDGSATEMLKVVQLDSSYRYRITVDPNTRYGKFKALSESFQIRLGFRSVVPLIVDYSFTPANYVKFTEVKWYGASLTVKFTSDLSMTQVRNYIRSVCVFGNTVGESSGSVTDWQYADGVYTLKASVGYWQESSGYYVAYVKSTMPDGSDVVNYSNGVSREVRSLTILSAVRNTSSVPPVVNTLIDVRNIPGFNVQNVSALQKAPTEGASWETLNVFSTPSSDTIVTMDVSQSGSAIKFVYPYGEETIESNDVMPIGG